jgi:hypothetical protein
MMSNQQREDLWAEYVIYYLFHSDDYMDGTTFLTYPNGDPYKAEVYEIDEDFNVPPGFKEEEIYLGQFRNWKELISTPKEDTAHNGEKYTSWYDLRVNEHPLLTEMKKTVVDNIYGFSRKELHTSALFEVCNEHWIDSLEKSLPKFIKCDQCCGEWNTETGRCVCDMETKMGFEFDINTIMEVSGGKSHIA